MLFTPAVILKGGSRPATFSYLGGNSSTTNTLNITASSMNMGPANPTKKALFVACGQRTSLPIDMVSATITTGSTTIPLETLLFKSGERWAYIGWADYPSGDQASWSLLLDNNTLIYAWGRFALTDLQYDEPLSVGYEEDISSGQSPTLDLLRVHGGFGVILGANNGSSFANLQAGPTGAPLRQETESGDRRAYFGCFDVYTATQGAETLSCYYSWQNNDNNINNLIAGASFR